jgi:NAD(P)-dependent dehydrogenase (short-subunit alcohol dehydrogenase family)
MMERQMLTRPNGEQGTLARIPLNRFATPAEQAAAAAWLLSDQGGLRDGRGTRRRRRRHHPVSGRTPRRFAIAFGRTGTLRA